MASFPDYFLSLNNLCSLKITLFPSQKNPPKLMFLVCIVKDIVNVVMLALHISNISCSGYLCYSYNFPQIEILEGKVIAVN